MSSGAFAEGPMPTRTLITELVLSSLVLIPGGAAADLTPQSNLTQDWSNTTLISSDDNWSGVPGIVGFRGDNLTALTGADPQTIVADGTATPIDVNANRADPNIFATGGVTEFDGIPNPV